MSPTAGFQGEGWWRGGAPAKREPARGLRALRRAFGRWLAQQRYRPERRYMRG